MKLLFTAKNLEIENLNNDGLWDNGTIGLNWHLDISQNQSQLAISIEVPEQRITFAANRSTETDDGFNYETIEANIHVGVEYTVDYSHIESRTKFSLNQPIELQRIELHGTKLRLFF